MHNDYKFVRLDRLDNGVISDIKLALIIFKKLLNIITKNINIIH